MTRGRTIPPAGDVGQSTFFHGDLTSLANVARDCGLDGKTVKENHQVLVDTLLGAWVPPWSAGRTGI
jgi:hypothetical protein